LYLGIADTLRPQMGVQARYSQKLAARIADTGSNLCVGLDPRIEQHGGEIGQVEAFLERVIEVTLAKTAVYKPNSAYFEAMGPDGIALLKRVIARVPEGVPVILDAKRSDIGETQRRYAQACYEVLGADAVTVNPFMGYDSLEPFLDFEGKGIYLLAVTSNPGSADLQRREAEGRKIFEYVEDVIARLPDVPLLIPGLGAQGGDLSTLKGTGRTAPNVVNVSRGVIYGDVADSIGGCAQHYADEIAAALA
jgi:orotidine-5'-phosphate decarboxylase